MSATQPIGPDFPRVTEEDTVKRQLDALAKGEIDHVAFLNAMKERFRFEPDENWEVLSLLDQYYRRGKISIEVFRAVKTGIAEYILGPQGGAQLSMPTLHKAAAAPAPNAKTIAAAPAPVVAPPAAPPAAAPAAAPAAVPVVIPQPVVAAAVAAPPVIMPPVASAPAVAPAAKPDAASVREIRVGDILRDRYRVEAILARGGSGSVFEISDGLRMNLPPVGKRLAVKVPRIPDPRGNFVSQLRHEFHQLQTLSHPNIVRVFDFDRDGALTFFTMELLNGVHLPQVLQAKGARILPRAHALAIIRDVGSALAYAHSRGVVHGDVNPQNIFITMTGELRLLGFGAAHKLSDAVPSPDFERASAVSNTQRYASCEVLERNHPDVQDDVYSLSCVAYLLLTGRHPFAESSSIEARANRLRPRRPAGVTYPQWRMLRAGLRTDVKHRPASVQELLDAMALTGAAQRLPAANELIEAPARRSQQLKITAAATVIVALIGAGYYWYSSSNGSTGTLPPLANEPQSQDVAPPTEAAQPNGPQPTNSPPVTAAPGATPPAAKPTPAQATPRSAATAPAAAAPVALAIAPAASAPAAGPARLEMTLDTLNVAATDTAVHVTVRRKGNLHGVTSFVWWTESGTAKPGTDFSPILPHAEQVQDGEPSVVLTVPLIATLRAQDKSFYVGIEAIDGGAQIGARALTQIVLPPTN